MTVPPVEHRAGTFVRQTAAGEAYRAFHPAPLPPRPPLRIDARMQDLLDRANQELGRLDGAMLLLPDPDRILYSYVRKEAVLSSQIEGTQSSLSDLLLFEHDVAPVAAAEDVRETSNYIRALEHGLARIRDGFPLSLRLLREIHAELLQGGRGADRAPGEFRTTQNWIGGTRPGNARYVPPPPHLVLSSMGDLEKFVHDKPVRTPLLLKAALAHAHFETIHPFLDGNGRVGRLLVTILLSSGEDAVLSKPLLYLSLYLKRNRDEYYERLQRVRTHGEWEEWTSFFLEGLTETAREARDTTQKVVALFDADRKRLVGLGKAAASAARLHDLAVHDVVLTIPSAARRLGLSEVTTGKAAKRLEQLGILEELTGYRRNRVFAYGGYLALLREE